MSLGRQLLALFLSGILSFLCFRSLMNGLKFYLLNRSALKKREKKETPIKWLLYINFQAGISIDTKGNFAVQGSFNGGATTGTAGASITSYLMYLIMLISKLWSGKNETY